MPCGRGACTSTPRPTCGSEHPAGSRVGHPEYAGGSTGRRVHVEQHRPQGVAIVCTLLLHPLRGRHAFLAVRVELVGEQAHHGHGALRALVDGLAQRGLGHDDLGLPRAQVAQPIHQLDELVEADLGHGETEEAEVEGDGGSLRAGDGGVLGHCSSSGNRGERSAHFHAHSVVARIARLIKSS